MRPSAARSGPARFCREPSSRRACSLSRLRTRASSQSARTSLCRCKLPPCHSRQVESRATRIKVHLSSIAFLSNHPLPIALRLATLACTAIRQSLQINCKMLSSFMRVMLRREPAQAHLFSVFWLLERAAFVEPKTKRSSLFGTAKDVPFRIRMHWAPFAFAHTCSEAVPFRSSDSICLRLCAIQFLKPCHSVKRLPLPATWQRIYTCFCCGE